MNYYFEELEASETFINFAPSKEAERIIKNIKETAFGLQDESEVKLLIQKHQYTLLRFIENNSNVTQSEEILYFLETYFIRFLDSSQKISKLSRQKLYENYGDEILFIIDEINNIAPVNFLVTLYPLLQLFGHIDRTIDKFLYQKKIIPVFSKFVRTNTLSFSGLCKFLSAYNYNHHQFVNFLIDNIIAETSQEDYLEQRLEILFEHHKSHTQIATYKNFNFDSRLPSVKEQILSWLNEEIKQCKRRLQKTPSNQNVLPFHKSSKFQTNLTVAQLSCLFKAFNDVGIVSFENDKELFRAVAENFVTPHTKQISVESLYNKQYDIEQRTQDTVKKILLDAVKSINS